MRSYEISRNILKIKYYLTSDNLKIMIELTEKNLVKNVNIDLQEKRKLKKEFPSKKKVGCFSYNSGKDQIKNKKKNLVIPPYENESGEFTEPFIRFVKKNGKLNVKRINYKQPFSFLSWVADGLSNCVDMRWYKVFLLFSSVYCSSWIFFAYIYWIIDNYRCPLSLPVCNDSCISSLDQNNRFLSSYLFSLETQTTIGYGYRHLNEKCMICIVLFGFQAFLRTIIGSFLAGLLWAKCLRSKYRAKTIIFTKHAVISKVNDRLALSFRVADLRKRALINSIITAKFVQQRYTKEGELLLNDQTTLELTPTNLMLSIPETVVHYIDENSPLWTLSKKCLEKKQFEIIILLEGVIEATGLTTQIRESYMPPEILWGYMFKQLVDKKPKKHYVSVDRLNEVAEVDCPVDSASVLYGVSN